MSIIYKTFDQPRYVGPVDGSGKPKTPFSHCGDEGWCGTSDNDKTVYSCPTGGIKWSKVTNCYPCADQPTCSSSDFSTCRAFGNVPVKSAALTDSAAWTSGNHKITCSWDANLFTDVRSVQEYVKTYGYDDSWRSQIMPAFTALPADYPPDWAGHLDSNDDTSPIWCHRMFSTTADGVMTRKWRDDAYSRWSAGDTGSTDGYNAAIKGWATKYPWLPECRCMVRGDPGPPDGYGDPDYAVLDVALNGGTSNAGCWYGPCSGSDENLLKMLVPCYEARPVAGACDGDCQQLNAVINDKNIYIGYVEQNIMCPGIEQPNTDSAINKKQFRIGAIVGFAVPMILVVALVVPSLLKNKKS
jgi:hypothetical protein